MNVPYCQRSQKSEVLMKKSNKLIIEPYKATELKQIEVEVIVKTGNIKHLQCLASNLIF